jgi:phage-related protein
MREVAFYRTPAGRCPVEEFLDQLSGKQAQKIAWVLKLLEELDIVPKQYLKKLPASEDIWEVRVTVGKSTFRLLGFFESSGLVVLNHALQKKTREIPRQAIQLAENRKREYLRRKRK